MTTPTYILLSDQTLATAVASVTISSISQSYKDLIIEVVGTTSTNLATVGLQFNNDATSGNYYFVWIVGDGANAGTGVYSPMAVAKIGDFSSTTISNTTASIFNYTSTNMFKIVSSSGGAPDSKVEIYESSWKNTAAINTIKIMVEGGPTFSVGTTIRLWGIVG